MFSLTIYSKGPVHGLQGTDLIVFGHQSVDADFPVGDYLDVDPGFRDTSDTLPALPDVEGMPPPQH